MAREAGKRSSFWSGRGKLDDDRGIKGVKVSRCRDGTERNNYGDDSNIEEDDDDDNDDDDNNNNNYNNNNNN